MPLFVKKLWNQGSLVPKIVPKEVEEELKEMSIEETFLKAEAKAKEKVEKMSMKEGLTSTDAANINTGWEAAIGQVNKNLNNLKDSLVMKDGKFLFKEIDDKKAL